MAIITIQETEILSNALIDFGLEPYPREDKVLGNTYWGQVLAHLQRQLVAVGSAADARELLHSRSYYAQYERSETVTEEQSITGREDTTAAQEAARRAAERAERAFEMPSWAPLALLGVVGLVILTGK